MTLEQLLNKLIEKGWKPFRWKDIKRVNNEGWFVCFVHKSKKQHWLSEVSYRELVSKESGLWQFVCENGMVEYIDCAYCKYIQNDEEIWYETQSNDYRYRLIESALKDESELEEFLLNNINIEG